MNKKAEQDSHEKQQGFSISDLANSEYDLKYVISSIDDIIVKVDENGNFINIWSKSYYKLSDDNLTDRPSSVDTLMDKESAEIVKEKIKSVLNTGKSEIFEYKLNLASGDYKWLQARFNLISDNKSNVVITVRDVTEQKEHEASLNAAKEYAEKANKAKSEFLSSMSHELRTPLNAILGFSQLMELDSEAPLTKSQKHSIKEIISAGNHLLELINEVLDLSKIESGKMTLSIEPVQVKPVVKEILSLIKPLADQNNIRIIYKESENKDYFILADRTRIKQVLLNLLSNAIKYNNSGGQVILSWKKINDFVKFNVIDTGTGIPEQDLNLIFQPFYRINERTSMVEGTGIGLTLVKQLGELMKGTVGVESSLGEGSHFWIDMPYTDNNSEYDSLSSKPLSPATTSIFHNKSHSILYVEDNPANLRLLERALAKIENLRVFSASSGILALDIATTYRPDLILLDINLPGMDGYEIFRKLKTNTITKNIPVVAISANAMSKDIDKALALGFKDYITKPIIITNFLQKVTEILLNKE